MAAQRANEPLRDGRPGTVRNGSLPSLRKRVLFVQALEVVVLATLAFDFPGQGKRSKLWVPGLLLRALWHGTRPTLKCWCVGSSGLIGNVDCGNVASGLAALGVDLSLWGSYRPSRRTQEAAPRSQAGTVWSTDLTPSLTLTLSTLHKPCTNEKWFARSFSSAARPAPESL